MSEKKEEGDLRESEAVTLDEDGEAMFKPEVTSNADTDDTSDSGVYHGMETGDDE
jgi:hypothetical protein